MVGVVEITPVGVTHAGVLAALHGLAFADPALSGPPWDEASFTSLLSTPGVLGFILTEDGTPRALSLWRQVLDEAELLTIGTDPTAQGRGHGRALVTHGLAFLAAATVARVFLEVAETNTVAMGLYASCGFANAGRRRGYYQYGGRMIDAMVMLALLDLSQDG